MEKELLIAALKAQIIVYECQTKATERIYDHASDMAKMSIKTSWDIMEETLVLMRKQLYELEND